MSIEKKRQRRPMRVVVAGGAGFALVLLLTAGTKGWADLDSVREREELLLSRVERTQTAIERLERRLILLVDDEQTLERLAREELGMVYPNDFIVVLKPRD